jgi:hypothetical protein
MKKLSLYVFLALIFCNVGFADEVSFDLKLSCTLIEMKKILAKKTYPIDIVSNQKPVIFRNKKIIKNNKIKSWWLKAPGESPHPDMIAVDWNRQKASERELTSDEKLILEGYNEFEKKYKQPGGTMFFYKTENLGYSHAYLSNDNSELLAIEVLTDPEFLKSINVVGELTISNKFRCEALK